MRASTSAWITLSELPLVDSAISASPAPPYAITWREKIASVPMSLAIAVRIAGSSVRSSARRPALRKSATTSVASVAEPPLPSASSVPPAASLARSSRAAASSVSAPSVSVCSRSAPTSSAFMRTDAATSAITASTSTSCSPRNG